MMRKRIIAFALVAVVAAGAITAGVLVVLAPKIPPAMARQVSFVVGYPAADWKVDRGSFRFQADAGKVLTFTATRGDVELTVAEQPTPEPFKDIPNYMDKITTQMAEFASFDTAHGTVHLTRPQSAGSRQVAVVDYQGTLSFVRSSADLSQDDWRRYFNTLRTIN